MCPKWYKDHGEKVLKSDYSIPKERDYVRNKMINLFQPLIEELQIRNSSKKKSKLDYRIKFEDLKQLMKEKSL